MYVSCGERCYRACTYMCRLGTRVQSSSIPPLTTLYVLAPLEVVRVINRDCFYVFISAFDYVGLFLLHGITGPRAGCNNSGIWRWDKRQFSYQSWKIIWHSQRLQPKHVVDLQISHQPRCCQRGHLTGLGSQVRCQCKYSSTTPSPPQ